ncbi:MAG: hypothetical protein HY315_08110, partial [Acidobacteria bacterium]|nr:hypothetical protein [Acidobacteriota bacterium]
MGDVKTFIDIIKGIVDIISGAVTIVVAIGGALLAIGIWAISGTPKFRLQQVFWFPDTPPPDTPFPLSVQFHVFTGAVGSKVTTEIEVESLSVEQDGRPPCRLTPFTFLDVLELKDKGTTLTARTKEFSHTFLMEGTGSILKHIGFHFDASQEFSPSEGHLALQMKVNYTTYDPLRQALSLLRLARSPIRRTATYRFERSITSAQADELAQKTAMIWPYWYVKTEEKWLTQVRHRTATVRERRGISM